MRCAFIPRSNKDMVGITEQYVFTKPFQDDDPTNKHDPLLETTVKELRGSTAACQRSEEMKRLFVSCKECLCHGDLHTGSVMVNRDNSAKVSKTQPGVVSHDSSQQRFINKVMVYVNDAAWLFSRRSNSYT